MDFSSLLIGLIPLVVFVIVDIYAGTKTGIYSSLALGLLVFVFYAIKFDNIDGVMILEICLLLALGVVSIKGNNSVFFKFQPVIVGLVLSLFLAWFQFFDEPYLVKKIPLFIELVPEQKEIFESFLMIDLLSKVSFQLIFVFFIHAALVAYSAVRFKNIGWILMQLAIYPVFGVQMFLNTLNIGV